MAGQHHPPTSTPHPRDNPNSPTSPNPPTLPDGTTEITHLYLTFTTRLPPPNTTLPTPSSHSSPSPPSLPAPPNLAPYTNPQTWPQARKTLLLTLSCIATFLTAYTSGSYSPPQSLIQASLSPTPSIEAVLAGITTFCAGFALAPMVLAPLSEMNGRYPVFVVAGIVYVIFQGVCGVVKTIEGMLVARFLVGVGASVFSTMVGGVIADMWDAQGRNTPMAVFSGCVLAGTGLGPLVGAVMTERLEEGERWKWIFWHQVLAGGVVMIALVVLFRESRGSVLLSRKARKVNRWYEKLEEAGYFGVWCGEDGMLVEGGEDGGCETEEEKTSSTPPRQLKRIRWRVKEDEERASLGKMISISVSRPFHLLVAEPVIFFFSLWVGFAWSILYLCLGSIPFIFQTVYGWQLEQAGYIFAALIIGAVLATAVGIWQEQILHHPKWAHPLPSLPPSPSSTSTTSSTPAPIPSHKPPSPSLTDPLWHFLHTRLPPSSPESRLYFTCLTSTLLPLGLFLFGFTAQPHIHWIFPAIGLVLATMGILSIYLAVFNYFADTYGQYASSALAAQSFCRNVLGGAFPLVTGPLYRNLGGVRVGGLLGGIAAGLTVVPWVLVVWGERIRGRSRFASQLEKA